MVRGILFFLWLASSWATLVADRAAAQTLPDGCPDIQGTYYCDSWSHYHQRQVGGHFQRFERVPDPEPPRNTTIYRIFKYQLGQEAKEKGGVLVADGEKKWRDQTSKSGDYVVSRCEEGTLSFYAEVDIHKTRGSYYFKDDILVKKVFKEPRYWGRILLDHTYPCKKIEGNPEAAAGCNNHWCSWVMDQEKADCYDRLCKHLEKYQTCFNQNCGNDWSKPTARSTVNLVNQQLPQLAMGLSSPTTCAGQ